MVHFQLLNILLTLNNDITNPFFLRLKTNYIDLFLVHSAIGVGEVVKTYEAMLAGKAAGKIRLGKPWIHLHCLKKNNLPELYEMPSPN